jgi:hypothetical protein
LSGVGLDGSIVLKWIVYKKGVKACTGINPAKDTIVALVVTSGWGIVRPVE